MLLRNPKNSPVLERDRVLYLLPIPKFFSRYSGVGGHVAHAGGIVRGMVAAGYQLDLLTEETHPVIEGEGVMIHSLPLGSHTLLRQFFWAKPLIEATGRLRRQHKPRFCYIRYSARFSPWIPKLRTVLQKIPMVLEVNSFASQNHFWMKPWERRAFQSADLLVCVSETMRALVLSHFGMILKDKTVVVPNGVDIERFRTDASAVSFDGSAPLKIGYAGTFKPDYDLDTLLGAFRIVHTVRPDASLHLYGAGPYREKLQRQAAGMDTVFFHGAFPFLDMPRILKGSDILVYTMSSVNAFGSSTKLLEYMASGKPIVAARTPHVETLLGNEERGLLYAPGDAEALARQVLRFLHEPGLAVRLARNAVQETVNNHSWKVRIDQVLCELNQRSLLGGYIATHIP